MNSQTGPIRGLVARILNSREVALNIGADSGVKVGMRFKILDLRGEDILDPDTGTILGSLERIKVLVEITEVREKFAVASTFVTKHVNVGGQGPELSDFSRFLMPPQWIEKQETLRVSEHSLDDLTESESIVQVKDPAIQVVDEGSERE